MGKIKTTYQISTGQFEFIMIEDEVETQEQAIEAYHSLKKAYEPLPFPSSVGLDDKEWRVALDGYLTVGNCPSDVYERMNAVQKNIMQEIKRAMKRINPPELREHSLKRT